MLSKDSNPHISTGSRSATASCVSLGNGNIPTSRASSGSVGDMTSSTDPSVKVKALISSDVEMEDAVKVEDSDKHLVPTEPKETDEEMLGM